VKENMTNVQVALPYRTRGKIVERAEKSHKSLSGYLREVLTLVFTPELYVNKSEED